MRVRKKRVEFYHLQPVNKSAGIPSETELALWTHSAGLDGQIVGDGEEMIKTIWAQPHAGVAALHLAPIGSPVRTVHVGDSARMDSISGENFGPGSSATWVRFLPNNFAAVLSGPRGFAPTASRSIRSLSEYVNEFHDAPLFVPVPVLTRKSAEDLSDQNHRLKIRITKDQISQIEDLGGDLREALRLLGQNLDSRDGWIEVTIEEPRNKTWFHDRFLSPLIHRIDEAEMHPHFEKLQVDPDGRSKIDLLSAFLTTAVDVAVAENSNDPSPATAAAVLARAYHEVRDQLN